MYFKNPFLVFILTFLTISSSLANRRATHGESCNRNVRCDSRGSLVCKNGTCECIMPETMKFDSRYQRCSVLAGEKCVFTAVEGSNVIERSWREEMPCVPSAHCQDSFCTCFHGYYENSNGTCSQKKGHRENCESSNACRDDQFLVCSNEGHCDCNSTIATYDFSRKSCVSLAGQPCPPHQLCVTYAQCDPRYDYQCTCQPGYFATAEGLCERKRGFGESCKNDDYCLSHNQDEEDYGYTPTVNQLVCTEEGTCGCDSKVSIFDSSSNLCRRLAGASCVGFPFCVENSECGNRNSFYTSEETCECSSGYFQTTNGTCELKRIYGSECYSNDNCQDELMCNLRNGLCQCDESKSVYDIIKKKCVGLANSDCDSQHDCITNSECRWGNGEKRQCICENGFSRSSNGSCLASHGAKCSDHWTLSCHGEQGLVCKEGICACKYDRLQNFDTKVQNCVSEVGGPCDVSIPCASNSHCAENDNGLLKCQCNEGFVEVDGECQLSIGRPCNYTINDESPKCDSVAPLHCIEGKCQCGYLQIYDRELKKCRGKVGSACFIDEVKNPNECVNGALCEKRRSFLSSKGICKCAFGWKSTKDGRCTVIKGLQAEEPIAVENRTSILI